MIVKKHKGRPRLAETHLVLTGCCVRGECVKCKLKAAKPRHRCRVRDNADHAAMRARYCE